MHQCDLDKVGVDKKMWLHLRSNSGAVVCYHRLEQLTEECEEIFSEQKANET